MRTAILGLALVISGCNSIKVANMMRPDSLATVQAYRVFGMAELVDGADPQIYGDGNDAAVQAAIKDALTGKGMTFADDNEDFEIAWHVAITTKMGEPEMHTHYQEYGDGGINWTTSEFSAEFRIGTLVIDVFDSSSNEHVWRGTAEGQINALLTTEERHKRLAKAVGMVLEQFPPQ
jgi:hypothetical protein